MRAWLAGLGVIAMATPASGEAIEGKQSPTEILAEAHDEDWRSIDPQSVLVFQLEGGDVTVALNEAFAPRAVANMRALVSAGFYDGLSFYRVIDGFVAQGGDVFETRDLPAGASRNLKSEFEIALADLGEDAGIQLIDDADGYAGNVGFVDGFPVGVDERAKSAWLLHCAGALAMARDVEKDTGGTEFYITLQPQRYLDRNLTVFGRVIDGMALVQALARQAPPEEEGEPMGDAILRAYMADRPPAGVTPPTWRILRTETPLFADYLEARRNRPEDFFYYRPDHVDVCAHSVPVSVEPTEGGE